jgi:hypothetical protein
MNSENIIESIFTPFQESINCEQDVREVSGRTSETFRKQNVLGDSQHNERHRKASPRNHHHFTDNPPFSNGGRRYIEGTTVGQVYFCVKFQQLVAQQGISSKT